MNRSLLVSICLFSPLAFAAAPTVPRAVDLDAPGALRALQRDRPDDYAKVVKILREAPDQPPEHAPQWMRARFDARDAGYGSLLKTSYPPKAELSFVLGDTRYRAEITLRNDRPRFIPARR